MNLPYITEKKDTSYLAYIFESQDLFEKMGYKVLKSHQDKGFVKCTKVLHNGKDKLVYDIANYKSLDSLLDKISSEIFSNILKNIVDIIMEVKEIGFFEFQNILFEKEKIFIDPNNYKAYFVYLPYGSKKDVLESADIEETFKEMIIGIMLEYPKLKNPMLDELCMNLRTGIFTIDKIKDFLSSQHKSDKPDKIPEEKENPEEELKQTQPEPKIKRGLFGRKTGMVSGTKSKSIELKLEAEGGATEILGENFYPSLRIKGLQTSDKIDLIINKEEYVIGKKEDSVDGAITFNNAISRIHCKIIFEKGSHYIVDLGSANGTFVNGKKIEKENKVKINQGDRIKLADSEFILKPL